MTPARRLLDPAPAPPPGRLLWREAMPPPVVAGHDDPSELPAVDLIEVRGLRYGGRGLLGRDGRVTDTHGVTPFITLVMLRIKGEDSALGRAWAGALLDPDARLRRHDGPVLVPVHANWGYGHQLLEVAPRILLLHRDCPPDWPIALAEGAPAWLEGLVAAAAPGRPLLRFRSGEEVVEAPVLMGCSDPAPQARFAPGLMRLMDGLGDRLAPGPGPDGPPLVWVSRLGLGPSVHMIHKAEAIEALAVRLGYVPVRPETLSLAEQVRLFRSARVIAGEFGSGLHTAILGGSGTTVVALNWINPYQSGIAASVQGTVGYVQPEDGRFRDAQVVLVRPDMRIRFDRATVERRLAEAAAGIAPTSG